LAILALVIGGFIATLMVLVHFIERSRRLPAH
jgi:LPS O-antigen subunit length determinant protein (WzzB/FepE family)